MPLKIVRNDITKMNTEAIVNTACARPAVGAVVTVPYTRRQAMRSFWNTGKKRLGSCRRERHS